MNYYMPRQSKVSGLWRYTCRNDDRIYEIGYCQRDEEGRSPCPGHATPEEAAAHMKEYALDHARFDGRWNLSVEPCEVCGATTSRFARTVHAITVPLCEVHLNRDGLAGLDFRGQVIGTW